MGSLGSLGEPQGGRRRPRFLCPISHDSGGADQIRPTPTAAAPSPTSLHPHRWRHLPLSPQQQRPFNRSDEGHEESGSAEWQREIDALYGYYKEVSGHQLNPKELSCNTNDSIIACLLEGSLSCAKLTDEIYKRMKLQDGVTESFCYGYRWSGG
ncbi:unnamed protein product [Miscanthus lutarioriparius]|uniref:Uncharacterized protein n=1 Tax=Miscanthus lutarioriparius TaxID=422564 RepID=A0A811NFB3_9POAL|nr:unnamed protein product [Miscanthus lutarioriparius]